MKSFSFENDFEVLKLTEENKKKDWKKSLWAILLCEFFGTIALTLWIILPSTLAFSTPEAHSNNQEFWEAWAKIWQLMFMKALWAALFVVAIVYLLRPISVNLNPAVTIAEIGKKKWYLWTRNLKNYYSICGRNFCRFLCFFNCKSNGLLRSFR